MGTEPENQNQHRVSQVYFRQFGYLQDQKWLLSVYKKGLPHTDTMLIEEFTAEVNIFDLPRTNMKERRLFENHTSRIENYYNTAISTINSQKQLITKHRYLLVRFIASLICKSKQYRLFFKSLLEADDTRDKFLDEIFLIVNSEYRTEFKNLLQNNENDFQLNYVIWALMDHFVFIFNKFNFTILRDYNHIGWFTSENPVVLDPQDNFSWIIPPESEIYFPLSKDLCLFMYHPDSGRRDNPIRLLKTNKVNEIDLNLFNTINKKIALNDSEYLIFPTELGKTYLDTFSTQ